MKVSIIIPVKNNEIFLNRCVESVLNQTYNDYEVIIVVENGTENIIKLCNYYEKNNKKITFINKVNKMRNNLKNIGLEKAKGEYVTFVNPNDTIDKEFLKYHMYFAETHNAEIVSSRFYTNKRLFNNKIKDYESVYRDKDIMKNYMLMNIRSNVIAKLYKKSLFNNTLFPPEEYYDEFRTMYKLYDKCNTLVDIKLYTYNKESKQENYDYLSKIDYCVEMLGFIEEKYPELINYCKVKICCEAIYLMSKVEDRNDRKYLFEYVKLFRKYAINDRRLPRKVRSQVMKSLLGFNMLDTYIKITK